MSVTLVQLVSEARLRAASGYYDVHMTARARPSFGSALKGERLRVIAEIKLASPAAGQISTRSARELLAIYLSGGASSLSVLTEPEHFHGSMSDLKEAACSPLPVLMKDFVIDCRQIEAAACGGASAVLLIQEALHESELRQLMQCAHELKLEVVMESCTRSGMEAALRSEADVIALNQRDLRTMQVDRNACARILPQLERDERPLLVMSGIGTKADAILARRSGADAILVGEALARSEDPRGLLRSLGAVP